MIELKNIFFYRPLSFNSFIEIAIGVSIYLMIISIFTEKKTSLPNKLQFFVLPIVISFFYLLKILNILDLEKVPFNSLVVVFSGFILVVLIELKFKRS